jgi:hypothetical protein
MSMLFPNVSRRSFLQGMLALASNKVKLFSNNFTIANNTVIADFTEVAGGGYAAQTLTAANWGYTLADPLVALYSEFVEFDFTGPTMGSGKVYGYYITDSAGTTLIVAENITEYTPFLGGIISLSLRISLAGE